MSDLVFFPINVQALCVANDGLNYVQREYSFENLYYDSVGEAPLGENLVNGAYEGKTGHGLGVHLHWAMPEAISHIVQKEKENNEEAEDEILPTPNRWLITRIVKDSNGVDKNNHKSWIIESNRLIHPDHLEEWEKEELLTSIPYQSYEQENDVPYRYLGRCYPLEEWKPQQQQENPEDYLDDLTVLGYGQLHFAAFYPNCNSVFGFHDKKAPKGVALSYSVIGWYEAPEQDTLVYEQTEDIREFLIRPMLQQLQDNVVNTDQDLDSSNAPIDLQNYIYHGLVYDVIWSDKDSDIRDKYQSDLTLENVKIGIGNTSQEVFSVMEAAQHQDKPKVSTEYFLNLMQHDLIKNQEVASVQVDTQLAEQLFEQSFEAFKGGTKYTISKETSEQEYEQVLKINNLLAKRDALARNLQSLQKQVYADWYKYVQLKYNDTDFRKSVNEIISQAPALNEQEKSDLQAKLVEVGYDQADFEDFLKDITFDEAQLNDKLFNLLDGLGDLENQGGRIQQVKEQLAKTEKDLADAKALLQTEPTPLPKKYFVAPKDPTLLLYHPQLDGWNFVKKRSQASGEILQLRTAKDLATKTGSIKISEPKGWNNNWPWEFINQLLIEAELYIIDKADNSFKAAEPISRTKWERNPWLPLLLDWTVDFIPAAAGSSDNFESDFLEQNFVFHHSGDMTYSNHWKAAKKHSFSGRSILNDLADYPVAEKCRKASNSDHQSEFKKGTMCLIQQLDGFTEALQMRRKTIEFKIVDPDAEFEEEKEFVNLVDQFVGGASNQSIDPTMPFCPIRNGIFQIAQLRIIDIFGQVKEIISPEKMIHTKVHYAQSLRISPELKNHIPNFGGQLPPRITQASRLNFDLLPYSYKTPVYGWLIPNHLQNTILLFDAQGNAQGYLGRGNDGKIAYLNDLIDTTNTFELNPVLNAVLQFFKGHDLNRLEHFIKLHQIGLQDKLFPIQRPAYQLHHLLGRPIAISKASLSVELMHLPSTLQTWRAAIINTQASEKFTELELELDRNYNNLQIPVHLGNAADHKEGLLGFFTATENYQQFHSPYTTSEQPEFKKDCTIQIPLSYPSLSIIDGTKADQGIREVIILVDPELSTQVATGVHPKARINLDPDIVSKTLSKLKFNFPIHPVLSTQKQIGIPTTDHESLEWSWLQKEDSEKEKIIKKAIVPPLEVLSDQVWLIEGWLSLDNK